MEISEKLVACIQFRSEGIRLTLNNSVCPHDRLQKGKYFHLVVLQGETKIPVGDIRSVLPADNETYKAMQKFHAHFMVTHALSETKNVANEKPPRAGKKKDACVIS